MLHKTITECVFAVFGSTKGLDRCNHRAQLNEVGSGVLSVPLGSPQLRTDQVVAWNNQAMHSLRLALLKEG